MAKAENWARAYFGAEVNMPVSGIISMAYSGTVVGYMEPDRALIYSNDSNIGLSLERIEEMLGLKAMLLDPAYAVSTKICAWEIKDLQVASKPSGGKEYPHKCGRCGAPAYVGVAPADVDCSSYTCINRRG